MDNYKNRREMNGKRVADAFRGKDWKPTEQHHITIRRDEPSLVPKPKKDNAKRRGKEDEYSNRHPMPNENKHIEIHGPKPKPSTPKDTGNPKYDETHRRPKPNEYPDNGDDKPHGGISPKPKPVGPKPGLPGLAKLPSKVKYAPSPNDQEAFERYFSESH